MTGVRGPQSIWKPIVENKIAIILHGENTVCTHRVTSPLGIFIGSGIHRVVYNQVTVGLHSHVPLSVWTVGVWGPNRLVTSMINNEVAVFLHDRVEDTVSADNLLVDIKFLALVKAVALLRLIHHVHRLLLHVLLLLHVVLRLRVHWVLVHRIRSRSVHAAVEAMLGVLHLDNLSLICVFALLFALATTYTQKDAQDAAEARNPNYNAEKTTRALGKNIAFGADRLRRVLTRWNWANACHRVRLAWFETNAPFGESITAGRRTSIVVGAETGNTQAGRPI